MRGKKLPIPQKRKLDLDHSPLDFRGALSRLQFDRKVKIVRQNQDLRLKNDTRFMNRRDCQQTISRIFRAE